MAHTFRQTVNKQTDETRIKTQQTTVVVSLDLLRLKFEPVRTRRVSPEFHQHGGDQSAAARRRRRLILRAEQLRCRPHSN